MEAHTTPLISRRTLIIVVAVIALLTLFPTLFRIVFASDDEVSYEADIGISTCIDLFVDDTSDAESCVSNYHITLGNTGVNPQRLVSITLPSHPQMLRYSTNVRDIVASAERRAAPLISEEVDGDTRMFRIENLQPNRMVTLGFTARGVSAYEQMRSMTIHIDAAGVIIATSPQMTVVSRFLRNLTSVFGL